MTDYSKYILSTSPHYISNSGSDERGKYTGGKGGDQNGGEWALKKWYSRPWTVVLRWPDRRVGTCIAQLGIEAALNDLIGYDQSQRGTYWTALKAAGYRPSRITTACEEDCTAGVTANVKAAGELLGIPALKALPTSCSSRNMRAKFVSAGFQALTDAKYLTGSLYLMPGDILLYESHHAATNVTHGALAGAYEYEDVLGSLDGSAPAPQPGVKQVEITCASLNVRTGDSPTYPRCTETQDGYAHQGERYEYVATSELTGWYAIRFGKCVCWVSNNYSKVVTNQ